MVSELPSCNFFVLLSDSFLLSKFCKFTSILFISPSTDASWQGILVSDHKTFVHRGYSLYTERTYTGRMCNCLWTSVEYEYVGLSVVILAD